ncbi:DUF6000 family protein [Streptomyces sp. NPDC058231]|uniref:DUF6000 family protein n=1 Tax=Streptomyces sp. NPDC058231 TaxID=3346392 RepID=UPI0036F0F614
MLSGHFTRQEGAVRKRFVRGMVHDTTAITDEELEALFDFEWRARLTASWLVGVGRRHKFRQQIGVSRGTALGLGRARICPREERYRK